MTNSPPFAAYIDTSVPMAIHYNEPAGVGIARRLNNVQMMMSSPILEAELLWATDNDGLPDIRRQTARFLWVMPHDTPTVEIGRVHRVANLEPLRLWHLAIALQAKRHLPGLAFMTLDEQQQSAAQELGFDLYLS